MSTAILFKILCNDGGSSSLMHLAILKNIFIQQLPRMPRAYIARFVLDRRHKVLAIFRGNVPIGGVCFRTFENQKFCEIVFLAISASEQVQGYGTMLMNHFKQYAVTQGITHFLTYADNFAIGYFKKQGFVNRIEMPIELWKGYIKHYDGGTLMECYVHPNLPYSSICDALKKQIEYVTSRIEQNQKISKSNRQHRISVQKTLSITNPLRDIPGAIEAGWTRQLVERTLGRSPNVTDLERFSNVSGSTFNNNTQKKKRKRPPSITEPIQDDNVKKKRPPTETGKISEYSIKKKRPTPHNPELRNELLKIWDQVQRSKYAWPFHEPVDTELVQGYLDVIKYPMDLRTIKERIDRGTFYKSKKQVKDDMELMCENCRVFNMDGSVWFVAAERLSKVIKKAFEE